jgi:methyl-accepting chemotaxis protein
MTALLNHLRLPAKIALMMATLASQRQRTDAAPNHLADSTARVATDISLADDGLNALGEWREQTDKLRWNGSQAIGAYTCAIGQLRGNVSRIAAGAEEMSATSVELASQAEQLQNTIAYFRISAERGG